VVERLPADAGVGEGAAHGQVQVVRPRPRREPAVRQRPVEHVHPQLAAPDVHVVSAQRRRVHGKRPRHCAAVAHVHDHAAGRLRLAADGVAVAPRRHAEPARRPERGADQARHVAGRARLEHRHGLGAGEAPEVPRRLRDVGRVHAEAPAADVASELQELRGRLHRQPHGGDEGGHEEQRRHEHEAPRHCHQPARSYAMSFFTDHSGRVLLGGPRAIATGARERERGEEEWKVG
jgi:hypothetical protein